MWILPFRLLLRVSSVPNRIINKIGRRNVVGLIVVVLLITMAVLPNCWRMAKVIAKVLVLPSPPKQHLTHFLANRNLKQYLDQIGDPLYEPTNTKCHTLSMVKLLILVASEPGNFENRQETRRTWSKSHLTFFVMGVPKGLINGLVLKVNQVEATTYNDIILFDFLDHYQNLTLKTALMLKWVSYRCPQAGFVLKTDEDVLVNPWTIQEVIHDHPDSNLIGYRINNARFHRDPYSKYYVPHWLVRDNRIDQYLSGTGYLIKGDYVSKILQASYGVSIVNTEDVYITYLVAKKVLNMTLTHDSRMNPSRPWSPFVCSYWKRAIIHNVDGEEVNAIWTGLKTMSSEWIINRRLCDGNNLFKRDLSIFWHLLM